MPLSAKTIQRLSIALFAVLLLWGGYQTITYFGIPNHVNVLVGADQTAGVTQGCSENAFFCIGLQALLPAIELTLTRLRPLLAYGIWTIVLFAGLIAWQMAKGNSATKMRVELRPWHILTAFVLMSWLMLSVLTSYQPAGDLSMRSIVEPTRTVYPNIGEEGMTALQDNFNSLKDKGCLAFERQYTPDAGQYRLKSWCVHTHFIARGLSQLLFLLLLSLLFLSIGRALLRTTPLLREEDHSVFLEAVLSFGIGVCAVTVYLWLMAVFNLLIASVAWASFAIAFIALYKHARYWLRRFFSYHWETSFSWYSLYWWGGWFLLSYLAFNFISVIRPFPIGWDDLGAYLNRPRLMVSYGEFIHLLPSFQWEYLSALGYLLYGYNSFHGATTAMMINWLAGLFAVVVVMAFGRTFVEKRAGLLAAVLYYTLPLVGHFSFADMKIDNAVFAMSSLSLLATFIALFQVPSSQLQKRLWWLGLAGILGGFAFGFKPTAIMGAFAAISVIAGVSLHWSAFIGFVSLSTLAYTLMNVLKVDEISGRLQFTVSRPLLMVLLLVIAGAALAYAYIKSKKQLRPAVMQLSIFIAGLAVSIAPWVLHNNILSGNIIPHLQLSAPNTKAPIVDLAGTLDAENTKGTVLQLPENLQLDAMNSACQGTSKSEELDRYWGFRQGWGHYLTLPWRTVMNVDSVGYYVTTSPVLLLFPLLLLLPFFWRKEQGDWLRWLFAATLFMLVEWIFLANGVPWYGLVMFIGFAVGLEAMYFKAPDTMSRVLIGILMALGLVSCIGFRMWQFSMQQNLLEYPIGKTSAAAMLERTIPYYDDIADVVVRSSATGRPYAYRIGTFIPYFVPKNLEIFAFQDHQLDQFNCINQEHDHELTYRRLLAFGINSIIFDTNTATIERDPNGTLHQKVDEFVDFLNDPALPFQVVINAPESGIVFVLLGDLPDAPAEPVAEDTAE